MIQERIMNFLVKRDLEVIQGVVCSDDISHLDNLKGGTL